MSDVSLVPVEYPPEFESVSHVPVDYNPFSDDGVPQLAQVQQSQTQLAQPPDQPQQPQTEPAQPLDQAQQPAAGVERLYVGPPANFKQAPDVDESWNPDSENSGASGVSRSTASTLSPNNAPFKPFGELKPATFRPSQQIGYLAADALMALGMKPYTANDLSKRIGNLLGLSPLGVVGSALDLIDAKRRDDFPGVVAAALGMIPGARGVARAVADEAGAGVRALTNSVRRSPASRAAEKGFAGIGTTPNGGPTFAKSDHIYPAGPGQRSVFRMPLTGSRRQDVALANKMGGFTEKPEGYVWHHVDDFDPKSGKATLELVREDAHQATSPNAGSVSQYEKFHGIRYKR